jgi:uncharacterized NAD(P)/FAD-binding protein YdhS
VAIVGGGPRCLDLLERLVCRADGHALDVHVVEPGPLGVGLHAVDQPDYLLLNTVCEQVTGFTDESMLGSPGAVVTGPSLFDWARGRGVLVDGRPVRGTDHLPRALLGEYLNWVTARVLAAAPGSVRVHVHHTSAVAVTTVPGGERIDLVGEPPLVVDHVVLAVGHGERSPHLPGHVGDGPYPLPAAVADVVPGETVALQGVGLTGMDVLAALTVGRGGRFVDGTYLPSGREPHVVLVSRQGRPAMVRPRLNPGRRALPARYLTHQALGGGSLDFAADVLPLVLAEMEHRWRSYGGGASPDFRDLLLGGPPAAALRSTGTYRAWYTAQLTEDLARAGAGLGVDPVKEAVEVLRDHRDVIRAAVDHGRLTPASHEWFYGVFAGAANRLVIGPQLERHSELLALLAAGVVSVGPGPRPVLGFTSGGRTRLTSHDLVEPGSVVVDRLLIGHSPVVDPVNAANPLVSGLARAGRLTAVTASGRPVGVRVDRALRALDADGRAQPALHVFGPLAEGSTYYNHYVTSPGGPSKATADADRLARHLLSPLAQEQEREHVPA